MDTVDTITRSKMMAAVKSKNTTLEVEIRRRLFHLGYRYRLHQSNLPGKPDIVFPQYRTVVFIHGCFWHRHERDKLAESLFKSEVEAGRIQFRLRTDGHNWKLPDFIETDRIAEGRQLYRQDGTIVEKSLFSPVYADDLNDYEQRVACYLDGGQAVNWWHRNIAKRHYSLQGWRKHKVYPDFIFAMTADGEKQRLLIIEMKGNFLDNPDSKYKQKLLNLCSDMFTWENITTLGELELVYDPATTVTCALVYQDHWATDLAGIMPA